MVETLAVVSGLVWMLLMLRARHRLESGKPASQPGSNVPMDGKGRRLWLGRSTGVVGAVFGGFAGASLGGAFEVVAAGVAMLVFSLILVPRQKQQKSGHVERRQVEGPGHSNRSRGPRRSQ